MSAAGRRAVWRDLVERRLPEAARDHRDWPVRLDHCFARILLDHACGGPWRDSVPPPAHANLPPDRLEAAIALGEAVIAGEADLRALNRRSLAWRGKLRVAPPAKSLEGHGFLLRRWTRDDEAAFAAINADPEVMAYFPTLFTEDASRAQARRIDALFAEDGFGPWAVEQGGRFVGVVGAARMPHPLPFPGSEEPERSVELIWRLARDAWGRGLATRGARLALADLSARCGIDAVVALTAAGNRRSRGVMERLGMTFAGTFDHPAVPDGPLREHVLYRLDLPA